MKKRARLAVLLAVLVTAWMLPASAQDAALKTPTVPAAEESRLSEAANAPGGSIAFTNPTDPCIWPMLPAEEDGFACLTSTNWGADDSAAAVYASIQAKAGDVLSFAYKTSTEVGFDLLELNVDGNVEKVFSGESGWGRYAYAFETDGVHEIAFLYSKDDVDAAGSDAVYIRELQLFTGAAAAEALAANPVYPTSETVTLTVANADAKPIVFEDATFALVGMFGLADYYIVPTGEVQFLATLDASTDPDGACIINHYSGGGSMALAPIATAAGYAFSTPIDTRVETGYAYTDVHLVTARECGVTEVKVAVCFRSEDEVNAFVAQLQAQGYQVTGWDYIAQSSYTLTVIDQQGEFVEGVSIGIYAGEALLTAQTSDVDGMVAFTLPGGAYTVRISGVPEGYTFDASRTWRMEPAGGSLIIDVSRMEE